MTDYELNLLLSEEFQEYLKEDPFDFDLNEEILNEGKILNKIRWKLAMFSLRFLKESYINDFFMAYYSDKDGNPTDKGREFCQKSKKEKLAKMRELANNMKEDDKNKIINSQAAKQCEKSGIISMATGGVIAGLGITANTVGQSHIRSADYNARVNSDVSVWKNDMSISPKGNLIGGSTSLTTQEIAKAIKTNQSGLSVEHQTAFGFQRFGDDLANGKIGTFSGSQLTDPQMYANSGYGVDHISGGVSALASVGSTLLTLAGVASAAMWGSIIIGAVGVGRGIRKLHQANVMRREEVIDMLKNNKKEVNESLMYKSGMNLLAEETLFESMIDDNITSLTEGIVEEIKAIDETNLPAIIELRNRPIISKLSNVEVYIAEAMSSFKDMIFGKHISLEEALENAKKFSLVLGEEVAYSDIYKDAKVVSLGENLVVEYKNANIGLIDKYKNKLTQRAEYCNECLFGDLYDTDILVENIPAIIISELKLSDR